MSTTEAIRTYQREWKRRWKVANPGRRQEARNKYNAIPQNRITTLLSAARMRAKRKGLEYDPELSNLIAVDYCECCGVKLDYSVGKGVRYRSAAPSIDRIDNSIGYTVANCKVICTHCNSLKSDCTLEEAEAIVAYIKRYA